MFKILLKDMMTNIYLNLISDAHSLDLSFDLFMIHKGFIFDIITILIHNSCLFRYDKSNFQLLFVKLT